VWGGDIAPNSHILLLHVSDSSKVWVLILVKKRSVSHAFLFQTMTTQSMYLDMLTYGIFSEMLNNSPQHNIQFNMGKYHHNVILIHGYLDGILPGARSGFGGAIPSLD
jgi:hypothetical protein